jgi:hypothetical protein
VSAASRLAKADTRIVRPAAGSNIGLNTARVPGGISAIPQPDPIRAGGLLWGPADAAPWQCSIGYQLAVEQGRPVVSLVKRQPAEAGTA